MGIARLIADNLGGITGSFRVGQLADTFGMPCTPHNWGAFFDIAAAFQLELALPNCYWFEMPWPWEYPDRPYVKYKFRIDPDGYVPAPTDAGHGISARPRRPGQDHDADRPLTQAVTRSPGATARKRGSIDAHGMQHGIHESHGRRPRGG